MTRRAHLGRGYRPGIGSASASARYLESPWHLSRGVGVGFFLLILNGKECETEAEASARLWRGFGEASARLQ